MKKKDDMKINSDPDEILDENLEEKLEGLLNPVTPSSAYIDELQNRLTKTPEVVVEYPNYLISILVLSSGFVLGTLLLFFLSKIFRMTSSKAKA
jgi:hypothetical protein